MMNRATPAVSPEQAARPATASPTKKRDISSPLQRAASHGSPALKAEVIFATTFAANIAHPAAERAAAAATPARP